MKKTKRQKKYSEEEAWEEAEKIAVNDEKLKIYKGLFWSNCAPKTRKKIVKHFFWDEKELKRCSTAVEMNSKARSGL